MKLERRTMETSFLVGGPNYTELDFDLFLNEIRPEVNERIERDLRSMLSNDHLDDLVLDMALRGKRLRAGMTMVLFDLFSSDQEERDQAIDLAAAIEIAHTASLIIDDMVDGDRQLRGAQPLYMLKGYGRAMLESVGLLAYPYAITSRYGSEYVRDLSEAHRQTVIGAITEVDPRPEKKDVELYEKMILQKTGHLFGLAARFGARAAGCDEATVKALTSFGLWSGIDDAGRRRYF